MVEYKIVEKENHLAVHSTGYFGDYGKTLAQKRIDEGYCIRHWLNKKTTFVVVEVKKTK
jgi:hypothetical protein